MNAAYCTLQRYLQPGAFRRSHLWLPLHYRVEFRVWVKGVKHWGEEWGRKAGKDSELGGGWGVTKTKAEFKNKVYH